MVLLDGVEVRVWTQYVAALSATIGALAMGLCLGWSSLIENDLKEDAYDFKLTDEDFTWISSLFTLGAATICIPIGILITIIGRKLSMLILVVPFIIGYLLLIFAQNYIMLYVARYILGIAAGGFCVAAPIYTGEIASKQIRGTLGTFFQLMIVNGILLAYVLGATLKAILFTKVSFLVPIIFAVLFILMPESPTYYVSKDKLEKASASLKWFRGPNYDIGPEMQILLADRERTKNVSFLAVIKKKITIKSLGIGLGLMFAQQMCGINAVIFYSGSIYENANADSTLSTILVGIVQVVATFISAMIVDRIGRRILLLVSAFVMMLCSIVLGIYFFKQDQDESSVDSIKWLPVVCLCIFIALFSLGLGPVPWMMQGELFPTEIKGKLGSICGTFNWLCAFVVTKNFKDISDLIGNGQTFWLFSFFSVLSIVFIWFCVPETKNRTLMEIQEDLGGEKLKIETNK